MVTPWFWSPRSGPWVEEAVSNVIHHGYESEQGEVFDISFDVGAADLTIEIHDKGLPFDPDTMKYGS